MFDCLRLLFANWTQGVCGGVEEIGVRFQQRSVAGSKARKVDRVRLVANGHLIFRLGETAILLMNFVDQLLFLDSPLLIYRGNLSYQFLVHRFFVSKGRY